VVTNQQAMTVCVQQFQSTPPQGGDQRSCQPAKYTGNFNPHHRKVVTEQSGMGVVFNTISIHTTARW